MNNLRPTSTAIYSSQKTEPITESLAKIGKIMQTIQTLIDQAEIRDLHLRYCRGVDRMDWDLVRSCYHDDATDDHGAYKGEIDGYMAWITAALPQYESTFHFTGNQLIEVNGDTAWAEHYATVTHRRAACGDAPAADLSVNVRYVDRLERREGLWKIAKRVVVTDGDRLDRVDQTWLGSAVQQGRHSRDDISYDR